MSDLIDRGLINEDDLPEGDNTIGQHAGHALAAIARLCEENAQLKESIANA